VDPENARKLIKEADVEAARRAVVAAATELDGLAAQVWAFGLAEGARRALAIVAQMGAELAVGASQLYDAQRWYAGAALVRQLIEVEYLLFLFATDPGEPGRWINASKDDVRSMFSPAVMRERSGGRFRSTEYSVHCEMGGHPRLQGHVLLREHNILTLPDSLEALARPLQWVDLAQHVERMWAHYVASVAIHSPSNVYPDRFQGISSLFHEWHTTDPLPSRI
jgi:hypothetical protein